MPPGLKHNKIRSNKVAESSVLLRPHVIISGLSRRLSRNFHGAFLHYPVSVNMSCLVNDGAIRDIGVMWREHVSTSVFPGLHRAQSSYSIREKSGSVCVYHLTKGGSLDRQCWLAGPSRVLRSRDPPTGKAGQKSRRYLECLLAASGESYRCG